MVPEFEIRQLSRDELGTSTARLGRAKVAHEVIVRCDSGVFRRRYNSTYSYCSKVIMKLREVLRGKSGKREKVILLKWKDTGVAS